MSFLFKKMLKMGGQLDKRITGNPPHVVFSAVHYCLLFGE